jgi:hypothetical protein
MSARVLALLLALTVSTAVFGEEADPPSRVARLSLIQGDVSYQASGAGAPEAAELNRPLTWGDRLLTNRGSRAEMSVGTAAIRLDESTDLTIVNLDDDIVQLELNSGTLGVHVRELAEGETFEIDTANATVLLRQPGDYRIAVDSQGATVLAVRSGEAELDGGAGPIRLGDRQELFFTGEEQVADVQALGPLTDFDEWCIERERTLAGTHTTRYVSRDVVGYEDLDRYGNWWSEPGYGYVWAPTYISIGWAPYRFGHWSWIGPWGFTWIDYAPWGYAPFHYGRWAYLRHRWCWVPGPRHFRPVWAPALVGWHGMPGVRDPSHVGSVRWFPLGPRDVYVPTHHASARYVRAVNVSNTIIGNNAQITNAWRGRLRAPRFANRDAPDAVSSLPAPAFAANRFAGRVLRVTPNESGADAPRLATSPSATPHDPRRPEAFDSRDRAVRDDPRVSRPREAGGSGEPPAIVRPSESEGEASDARRSVPRTPPDRRVVRGFAGEQSAASDSQEGRRLEQPRTRVQEEPRRAMPADSWRSSEGQPDSRAFTPDARPGRSDRGGTIQTGGRSEPSGSVRGGTDSGGWARGSGSSGGSSSANGRGGHSASGGDSRSGSRSQSGRGGLSPQH